MKWFFNIIHVFIFLRGVFDWGKLVLINEARSLKYYNIFTVIGKTTCKWYTIMFVLLSTFEDIIDHWQMYLMYQNFVTFINISHFHTFGSWMCILARWHRNFQHVQFIYLEVFVLPWQYQWQFIASMIFTKTKTQQRFHTNRLMKIIILIRNLISV